MNLTKPTASAPKELQNALNAAIRGARAGREVLLQYFGRLSKIEEKFQAGLVSEADRESERAIFTSLRSNFPADEYFGEEGTSGQIDFITPAKGSRWVVDPLDGTTNYIHKFPIFAISIGLEIAGQMKVGVIDMPILGETYAAIAGHGAWVNGHPLHVSKTQVLQSALVATGFFSDHQILLTEQLRLFNGIVHKCRGVRRAGSAAYDLAQVARGVFDSYWEVGLKPWDTAAGMLLVSEAGGQVSTFKGQIYNPYCKSVLATNRHLHTQVVNEFENLVSDLSD